MIEPVAGADACPAGGVDGPFALYAEAEYWGNLFAEFSTDNAAGIVPETIVLNGFRREDRSTLEGERPVVGELAAGHGGLCRSGNSA